jgi:hypothetical protein
MRLKRPAVAAVTLSIIGGLGLLEVLLHLFPYMVKPPSLTRELKWRARHTINDEIITSRHHAFDQYSPELGWEPRPNFRSHRLTTNSQGLRGMREYDRQPPPDVRRILCVGDSFMFGEGVRDEESLPAQLERVLSTASDGGRWEALNLAVHGYGTDQQWLRLQRLGFQYTADVVVLGFFEDNLERNVMRFRDYAKPYFDLIEGRLVLRNTPLPSPEELLSHPPELPLCYVRSWCAAQGIAENLLSDVERSRAGRVTLAILDTMREESRNRGMAFVLMSIPRRIRQTASETEVMLSRWAYRTSTPFLNLREAYLRLPAPDQARLYDGHWTVYGTQLTAQLLAKRIREVIVPVSQDSTASPGP